MSNDRQQNPTLYCFDWDQTITVRHMLANIPSLIDDVAYPQAYIYGHEATKQFPSTQKLKQNLPETLETAGKEVLKALFHKAKIKDMMNMAFSKNIKVAIVTFSQYPDLIFEVLKQLGVHEETLNSMVIIFGGIADDKNLHLASAMKYFNVQTIKEVFFVDDNLDNITAGKEIGCNSLQADIRKEWISKVMEYMKQTESLEFSGETIGSLEKTLDLNNKLMSPISMQEIIDNFYQRDYKLYCFDWKYTIESIDWSKADYLSTVAENPLYPLAYTFTREQITQIPLTLNPKVNSSSPTIQDFLEKNDCTMKYRDNLKQMLKNALTKNIKVAIVTFSEYPNLIFQILEKNGIDKKYLEKIVIIFGGSEVGNINLHLATAMKYFNIQSKEEVFFTANHPDLIKAAKEAGYNGYQAEGNKEWPSTVMRFMKKIENVEASKETIDSVEKTLAFNTELMQIESTGGTKKRKLSEDDVENTTMTTTTTTTTTEEELHSETKKFKNNSPLPTQEDVPSLGDVEDFDV